MKIPAIRKILYTTDLSDNARYAFSYAVSLARQYDARITLLHVLEELSPTAQWMVGDIIGEKRWSALKDEKQDSVIDALRSRLQAFCEEVSENVPDCPFVVADTIVETGHPVDRIIELADTGEFDVIVMGCRGLGVLGDVMLGGTSRRVLRRCSKPVLVVRLPAETEA
jgi:nucleotide-binding universal stress UspA family protein